MAIKDILEPEDINFIVKNAEDHGGFISYKTGDDGTEVPYEINITWFSALNYADRDEDIAFQVKRFVASRVIALVLQGVPGIYLHSLIGTYNDIQSVLATESKRDINRTVIDAEAITKALQDPFSKIARISRELGRLIAIRGKKRAFHPNSSQRIIIISPDVFTVLRITREGNPLLAITNVTDRVCHVEIPLTEMGSNQARWYDLVSKMEWMADDGKLYFTLQPYDVIWLEPFREKK
jgi:sucrose phosphorylase